MSKVTDLSQRPHWVISQSSRLSKVTFIYDVTVLIDQVYTRKILQLVNRCVRTACSQLLTNLEQVIIIV